MLLSCKESSNTLGDILNWFVWMAVCGWLLNLNIVGLGDTVQDNRSLQCAVLNWRWHRKRIQWKIKDGQYFELVCLTDSVWFDTQSQYCGINDTPTTTKTYQINNLRILYTRGDAFNRWY